MLLASAQAQDEPESERWRQVAAAQTVYLDTADGRVVIELNPDYAPRTVARFKHLIEQRFYDGLGFYRVIDGFVAQGGDGSDLSGEHPQPTLPAEFERQLNASRPYTQVQQKDLFAAETGFQQGFAIGRDPQQQREWLLHCPGVVAMARGNESDSGSTDFYIVIGQAPRYLDRNLTIFGRVIHGMDVVQRIQRGAASDNGIINERAARTSIVRMRLASELPADQRQLIDVIDTHTPGFNNYLQQRRRRDQAFFQHQPPAVLDICQIPLASRIRAPADGYSQ
ncbi:MAG: peptidylprolyl isomerase [Wenzhouxiangellaceae bacterium]